MDVFSKRKRSEVMSRIRGYGNKSTERRMAALLRAYSIAGWQVRPRDVTGRPDVYFSRLRIAIFLDGCFWHACSRCFRMPAQNNAFWKKKLLANKRRDLQVTRSLKKDHIKVIRLWEHDLERFTPHLRSILKSLRRESVRRARGEKGRGPSQLGNSRGTPGKAYFISQGTGSLMESLSRVPRQ